MGLTVTEKEHWKDRIGRRIDKKVEAIYAEDANLKERIEREAQARALDLLHLSELERRLDEIQAEKERLEKEEKQVYKAQLAAVRGTTTEDLDDEDVPRNYYGVCRFDEVTAAIDRRKDYYSEQLLAQDERGRQILKLREEKENLPDTVWLATSPSHVRELWTKVNELLGATPSQLEQDALAIQPAAEE